MLSAFRKGGAAQIMGGAIVFAIIVVFVIQFRAGAGGPTGSLAKDCAVEVRGECVQPKDFFAAYGLIVPRGLPPKQARAMQLRKTVLEGLVERELLLKEAARLGISVTDEEVDELLLIGRAHISIPVADALMLSYPLGLGREMVRLLPVRNFKTKKFDYEIYKRVIRNTAGRSPKEFKEMQRKEIIAARMRDLVRSRVRVSEKEAFFAYQRDESEAVARVGRIPRDWFARYVVDISDPVVQAWADANTEQLDGTWATAKKAWKVGCPLVSEIFVGFEEGLDEDDKVLLRNQIDQAAARVESGDDFVTVARQTSKGPTAAMGGELGCLNDGYGEGHETLLEAVKNLKPGDVSPVLETKRGFHVVHLDGRLEEGDLEAVGRRTIARRMAVQAGAEDLARELAKALVDRVKGGEALDDAITALAREFALRAYDEPPGDDDPIPALEDPVRPRMEVSAPFSPATGSPIPDALPTGLPPAAIAFELGEPDDVHAEPIPTRAGYAILQLKEKTPATEEGYAEAKNDIMRQLRTRKEMDALTSYLARLRDEARKRVEINPRYAEEPRGDDEGAPTEG